MSVHSQLCYGTFANIQYLVQGKYLAPSDQSLEPAFDVLRMDRKLERVSTFRHLQALSNISQQLTGRQLSDYMAVSHGCMLRRISAGEYREVEDRGGKQHVLIVNSDTGERINALQPNVDDVPMILLGQYQCAVNKSAQYVCEFLIVVLFTAFDKIHRLIKDILKGLKRCCNGKFLAAKTVAPLLSVEVGHPWVAIDRRM